jgi:hypothetical protein
MNEYIQKIYIYIYNQSVISVYKKYIYIARRPVNPPTPIGTKMGINYPIQNGLPSLYIQNPDTHGAPRAPPPGPLSAGGAPPAGGPPGPGGS